MPVLVHVGVREPGRAGDGRERRGVRTVEEGLEPDGDEVGSVEGELAGGHGRENERRTWALGARALATTV